VNLIPTELNQRLAGATLFRIASEKSRIAARSGFWRLVGIGILGLSVGAATGIAFYGYSYVRRSSENIASLSTALSKALSDVRLHAVAQGNVSIEPHELSIAKGQVIGIDQNSFVRLDPAAKVLADGALKIQAPSISPPPSKQTASAQTTPTIANFTIFKSVNFEKGVVMTGWKFLTSAQKLPTGQYCYYTENSESPGLDVVVSIASDMKLEPPKTIPKNFDIAAAFERCVWFRSESQ
jgi:hypothetical protein